MTYGMSGFRLYWIAIKIVIFLAGNFFAFKGVTFLLNYPADTAFGLGLLAIAFLTVTDLIIVGRLVHKAVKFLNASEEITSENP